MKTPGAFRRIIGRVLVVLGFAVILPLPAVIALLYVASDENVLRLTAFSFIVMCVALALLFAGDAIRGPRRLGGRTASPASH